MLLQKFQNKADSVPDFSLQMKFFLKMTFVFTNSEPL